MKKKNAQPRNAELSARKNSANPTITAHAAIDLPHGDVSEVRDMTVFITRNGSELATDSRAVTLAFGKRHKNVLRVIESMRMSTHPEIAEHYRLNFELVDFLDAKGERRPMYRMTAKGLSELAMSFSGEKARVTRIRFLKAFEELSTRQHRAEQSITQMLHDLELRELSSLVKGQIGSQLMHLRRKEKPVFVKTRTLLMTLAQPDLLTCGMEGA